MKDVRNLKLVKSGFQISEYLLYLKVQTEFILHAYEYDRTLVLYMSQGFSGALWQDAACICCWKKGGNTRLRLRLNLSVCFNDHRSQTKPTKMFNLHISKSTFLRSPFSFFFCIKTQARLAKKIKRSKFNSTTLNQKTFWLPCVFPTAHPHVGTKGIPTYFARCFRTERDQLSHLKQMSFIPYQWTFSPSSVGICLLHSCPP